MFLWKTGIFAIFREKLSNSFKSEARKNRIVIKFMPLCIKILLGLRGINKKRRRRRKIFRRKKWWKNRLEKLYPCVWFEPGKVSQIKCSNFYLSTVLCKLISRKLHFVRKEKILQKYRRHEGTLLLRVSTDFGRHEIAQVFSFSSVQYIFKARRNIPPAWPDDAESKVKAAERAFVYVWRKDPPKFRSH